MPILISAGKKLKFSVLVGTIIKSTETAAEMKTKLSPCISMSTYSCSWGSIGIKKYALSSCFISAAVSALLLQSLLNRKFQIFPELVCALFLVMQSNS